MSFQWDRNGRLVVATLEDHLKQCLRAAILTGRGERTLRPELGSDIRELLFRPLDSRLSTELAGLVRDAIARAESRVDVLDVTLQAAETDRTRLQAELKYRVKATQKSAAMKVAIAP